MERTGDGEGAEGFPEQEPKEAFSALLTNEQKQLDALTRGPSLGKEGGSRTSRNSCSQSWWSTGWQSGPHPLSRKAWGASNLRFQPSRPLSSSPGPPAFPRVGLELKQRLKELQLKLQQY